MQSWHVPLLGRRRFTGDLIGFEVERFFTFYDVERANILSRNNDRHRVAVAVHMGFTRMTGRYLHAFNSIPASMLRHIGRQLDVPVPNIATLRVMYWRERTLEAHQQWATRALGYKMPEQREIEQLKREKAKLERELEIAKGCLMLPKKALAMLDLTNNGNET